MSLRVCVDSYAVTWPYHRLGFSPSFSWSVSSHVSMCLPAGVLLTAVWQGMLSQSPLDNPNFSSMLL